MLTTRTNFHHSKIPHIGAVGRIRGLEQSGISERRRCQVAYYPLNDNVGPYSIGIHTCFVRFLHSGEVRKVAGHFFEEDERYCRSSRREAGKEVSFGQRALAA